MKPTRVANPSCLPRLCKGYLVWLLFLSATVVWAKPNPNQLVMRSPNKKVELTLTGAGDSLRYSVRYRGQPILDESSLGLTLNQQRLGGKVSLGETEQYSHNEKYVWRGGHGEALDHCQGYKTKLLAATDNVEMVLETRMFNNGVAFRYVIQKQDSSRITKDNTSFTVPAGSTVWYQENINYYEGSYKKALAEEVPAGKRMGPPVTVQLPANLGYAAITEGGLTDFGGMSLVADGKRGFRSNLAGTTRKLGKVETPWRIIMIGADLNELVNNDIVANVSLAYDPKLFPQGFATDWVKPGRSVWSWLAEKRSVTPENMKEFARLAGQLGFEYNLIDEGWSDWKEGDKDAWALLKEVVDYSAQQGVKVWVWKAYPDRKGIPGIKEVAQRREFFRRCKELGVAGLKVDFFDSEKQEIVDFYQAGLHDAAEYQLMMNFHGANKPTGESRTWPNELTREAIRGLENRPPWAMQTTILPFTRYLAGHADYTPLHFGNRMGEISWAHHFATLVAFTSPLLCIGADPQQILDNPHRDLITGIPSTWDETRVLEPSKIGELVVVARRKGTTWYLAAMNAGPTRQEKINLSFLGKDAYEATLLSDNKLQQASADRRTMLLKRKDTLTLEMNAAGGFLAKFTKK